MMSPGFSFVSLFDGVCDSTKELKTLTGKMPYDDRWEISSSGHHIYINFVVDFVNTQPGFSAKIHYGNEIKGFCINQ